MIGYRKEKCAEMMRDGLRAVTGWEGPIRVDGSRVIFVRTDDSPALEVDRDHAMDVYKKVMDQGGTYKVAHDPRIHSTSNVRASPYRP